MRFEFWKEALHNHSLNMMNVVYPIKKCVSIWVGTFADEEQMNDCMDKLIEPSLELSGPMSAISEVSLEADAMPLRQLLEGFSGWRTFIDTASRAGVNLGIETANGALVCYYLSCDAPVDFWSGIKFLGSFEGQDVT